MDKSEIAWEMGWGMGKSSFHLLMSMVTLNFKLVAEILVIDNFGDQSSFNVHANS